MEKIIVKDILEKCNGTLLYGNNNIECEKYSRDSRDIKDGDVYVGIKGVNFNGSTFYLDALSKGAKVCLIQDIDIYNDIEFLDQTYGNNEIAIVRVKNVIEAIQNLARYKRSLYDIPVIAVTGSVGKTSTKDIIASALATHYNVLKTEGNLNNHIGLPLTILRLKEHDAMVIEMGMNNKGEISLLTSIGNPTIAVITNVGTAHIGNLGSRDNILKAKLEIIEGLRENGTLIINNDNDMLNEWYKQFDKGSSKFNVMTFGVDNQSDLTGYDLNIESNFTEFKTMIDGNEEVVNVPIGSTPFVYNSLCALCIAKLLKLNINKAKEGIKNFELSKNRLEVFDSNGIRIINDCYNANYDSMKAAIEILKREKGNRKIAVLGDMLELGDYSEKLHRKVGTEVVKNDIDILVVIGKDAKYISEEAKLYGMNEKNIYEYDNNKDAIEKINSIKNEDDVVLVKASNSMKFIEIIEALKIK